MLACLRVRRDFPPPPMVVVETNPDRERALRHALVNAVEHLRRNLDAVDEWLGTRRDNGRNPVELPASAARAAWPNPCHDTHQRHVAVVRSSNRGHGAESAVRLFFILRRRDACTDRTDRDGRSLGDGVGTIRPRTEPASARTSRMIAAIRTNAPPTARTSPHPPGTLKYSTAWESFAEGNRQHGAPSLPARQEAAPWLRLDTGQLHARTAKRLKRGPLWCLARC